MNSFAHYSFGAVYQWMIENIGGIRSDGPAFKKIIIAPQMNDGMNSAKTEYTSIQGRIATDWKVESGQLALNISIPANTTATVFVPAKDAAAVTESAKPAAQSEGVKFLRMEGPAAVFEVGSGTYHFVSSRETGGKEG
jgi:alpha-L-rhamnosidase